MKYSKKMYLCFLTGRIVTDVSKRNEKGVISQAFEIKVMHSIINSKPPLVALIIILFWQVFSW